MENQTATPTEQLKATLSEIRAALDAGVIDLETYNRDVKSAQEEFGQVREITDG